MSSNLKIKSLKGISIALTIVLALQILALPVSATTNNTNNENEIEDNDEEITPIRAKQIDEDVEIVELGWEEVQRLLDRTGDVEFDGFGDQDEYQEYRAREEAGVTDTPGAEDVEDKFLTTNEGETVMLYDLMEHRAIDPTEVPHLSHMVTTGHMSYTTLLDETTRICPQYPDETCERGHLNPEEAARIQDEIERKEAEINQIAEGARDVGEEVKSYFEYPLIEAGDYLGLTGERNASEYFEEETSELERLKEEMEQESPLNTMQSNYSISHLQRADTTLLFPHHLAKFTQFLENLQTGLTGDRNYAILKGISAGIGIANLGKSIHGLKMSKRGTGMIDSAESKRKALSETKRAKAQVDQDIRRLNNIDDLSDAQQEKLGALRAKSIELDTFREKLADVSPAEGQSWSDAATQFGESEIIDGVPAEEIMKDVGKIKAYGSDAGSSLVGKGDTISSTQGIGRLLSEGFQLKGAGIRGFEAMKNSMAVFQGMLAVSFASLTFFGQPKPSFELMTLSIEAEPDRVIEDEEAYLEIARSTERAYGQDFYPSGVFKNLLDTFNFDIEEIMDEDEAETVRRKIEQDPGPGYVKVIDQETSAETYTAKPVNMIYPTRIGDGTGERWMINSINPTMTDYQAFEHPKSYAEGDGELFSTFALIVKDLDMGGLTTVEQDWAEHSGDWLVDYTPTTRTMVYGSTIAGVLTGLSPTGMFTGRVGPGVVKGLVATYMIRGWGHLGEEEAKRMQEQDYGTLVDVGEAYREGTPCSVEMDILKDDINDARRWMWTFLMGKTGLDIAKMAGTYGAITMGTGPIGGAALSGMIIASSIGNYYSTREYQELRTDGLDRMKECQETMFEILAISSMGTDEKQTEETMEQIKGRLGETLSGIPGLESISPEAKETLENLGPQTYENVMALSGKVEGESMTNLFGTELYQVHFDREADVKWFLEEHQNIDFCTQVDTTLEGKPIFECVHAEGYQLLDEEGRPIIDGPQTRGVRWDNDRELMTIPQRVVNVKQTEGELMEIEKDQVRIDDSSTQEGVQEIIGKTDTRDIFGELQTIKTEEAVVWHDGDTTVARFTEPVGDTIGRGTVLRFDNTHVQMYKNNEIEIQSNTDDSQALDHTLELGENGFLSFTNGKLVPGTGEHELTVNNQTVTRDFGEWNHLILYDLLSFTAERADDYWIEGIQRDEDGNIIGFEMGGDFPAEHQDQMDELLREMMFNDLRGPDGRMMRIEDNELIYVDETGEEHRYEIIGEEDGRLILEDGRVLDLEVGPDGQPQAQFYQNGEQVGAPIPLLRATGAGGMMGYNPETGEISISNEFPFQLNPSFGDIGAGMTNPGMVVPQASEFGGRPPERDIDTVINGRDPGLIAELSSTPGRESQIEQPGQETELEGETMETTTTLPTGKIALVIFIAVILGGVIAIRKKGMKKNEDKQK